MKKIINRIHTFIFGYTCSLKTKEISLVFLAMFLPMLLFLYVINFLVVNTNRNNSFQTISNACDIFKSTIDEQTSTIYRYSIILLQDPNVRYLIQDSQKEPALSFYIQQKSEATTLIDTLSASDFVDSMNFYVSDAYSNLFDNHTFFDIKFLSKECYSALTSTPQKGAWYIDTTIPNTPKISYLVKVVHPDDYHQFGAIMKINYSSAYLQQIFFSSISKNTSSFLVDKNGNVLLSAGDHINNKIIENSSQLKAKSFQKLQLNGEWYWAYALPLKNMSVDIITIVPEKSFSFFSMYDTAFYRIITIVLASWFLFLYIAMANITNITSRIEAITHYVNLQRKTTEIVSIPKFKEKDELTYLADNFNLLSKELNDNIAKIYQLGLEKRSSDLRALQSQINPHFLYNSLDLIDFYAFDAKPEVVEEIVSKLALFYKLSLNHGKELHPLADELCLVSSYFDIQRIRFQNKLHLKIAVPEQFMQVLIPPITLQPLVENSILHGIREREDKCGCITIQAKAESNILKIYVIDDGIGMSAQFISSMNDMLIENEPINSTLKDTHYGLRNINQRIQLMFGTEFGLRISDVSKGSAVIVLLPQ